MSVKVEGKNRYYTGTLVCWSCPLVWDGKDINLARETLYCPCCGKQNGILEAAKRGESEVEMRASL